VSVDGGEWFPPEPYLERADEPVARSDRPIGMGDVFLGHPVIRGAREVKPTQWRVKTAWKPEALAMLVAHPCSARANETSALKDNISLAPVVPMPAPFERPWSGYYELFPLPDLYGSNDYVADLSRVFPCLPEYLEGKRIACLNEGGLAALLDRLARNSTRLEPVHVPGHFEAEAERLRMEFDLWEIWLKGHGEEAGFHEWMKGEWLDGSSRLQSMRGHFEEICASLAEEVGLELEP